MTRRIKLLGLDCGSTTTSAVVAAARLETSALGRVEISQVEPIFRSEVIFTPFVGDTIDGPRLERTLDQWLALAGTDVGEIFGGGALVTGLAAERSNVAQITRLIENRLADAVVATANDPCLESWLAFMGNCHALSMAHPQTPILNLDIGGGTTNLALGFDGQVLATGSLYVGARHVQFQPGTYTLTGVSRHAAPLLEQLHIARGVADTLTVEEIQAVVEFYVGLLESVIEGRPLAPNENLASRHVQVPLRLAGDAASRALLSCAAITLSGGVGQLVYERLRGEGADGVTRFGDLGDELAARIMRSAQITGRMGQLVPEGQGRATVFGLLKHNTELSGTTIHLPNPGLLPLKNVPIVGRISSESTDEELARALALAARSGEAACLQVELERPDLESVRNLGTRLAGQLETQPLAALRALVLLVPANLGKVLGGYSTRWGALGANVIVVDEVPRRDAQFVRLGRAREGVVPLSLYAVK